MESIAVSPTVGVASLVALTVGAALTVGIAVSEFGLGAPPQASIGVEAADGTITFTHQGGDPLDVTAITVRVFVDDIPLKHQPRVPDAGMDGFVGVPDGPFNSGSADTIWETGEIAGFEIATTNAPQPTPSDWLVVRIYSDGQPVAAETTVR